MVDDELQGCMAHRLPVELDPRARRGRLDEEATLSETPGSDERDERCQTESLVEIGQGVRREPSGSEGLRKTGGEGGIRTRGPRRGVTALAMLRIQPLCHLSAQGRGGYRPFTRATRGEVV